MGLLPGDVVDAISDGMDPVPGMHTDYFSVTRGSVGVIGTGVNAESTVLDTPPGVAPGHAGDLFVAGGGLPFGANLLAPAGFGWTLGTTTGDEANTGLITPTLPPALGDNVNAYDVAPILLGAPVLFSLAVGSPSLLLLGAGPADILGVGGPYGPVPVIVIFAGPALGLPPGADIDALASLGPVPGPGLLEYSLTAATAPLVPAALGSGATILGWLAPGVSIPVHTPAALGLLVVDDIDALDVDLPIPACSDGIDNDGDFFADFPADPDCTSPLDPTEYPDSDGDLVADSLDNCPYEPNSAQTDTGGLGAAPPDGIGDACQCGDINDNGTVTATDSTQLSRALINLSARFSIGGNAVCTGAGTPVPCCSGIGTGACDPGLLPAGLNKCNVGNTVVPGIPGCTGTDATTISRALINLATVRQNCDATQP